MNDQVVDKKDSDPVIEESMEVEEANNDEKTDEEEEIEAEEPFEGPKDVGGFTVLGDYKAKETLAIGRVLPNWLRYPKLIDGTDVKSFADVETLDQDLIEKLKENDITKCFPVQWTVIPELVAQNTCGIYAGDAGFRPRDICVSAPTGSGKTLTFVLPVVQALRHRVVPHVRALVILPVKDLAIQVYSVFKKYSEGTPLKVCLLSGKKDFASEQKQLVRERIPIGGGAKSWTSSVDIVVATKGRLLDHLDRTEGFDLSHLRYLVIDEADRQMDDIYDEWLARVERAAYSVKPGVYAPYHRSQHDCLTVASAAEGTMHVQKLLFSATLSQNPDKLEQMNLYLPLLFTVVSPSSKPAAASSSSGAASKAGVTSNGDSVSQFSTPDHLQEHFIDTPASEKPLVLFYLVSTLQYKHVLCFTNSVESAHRLYLLANQMPGLKVAQLSSNVHMEKRQRIIRRFVRGDVQLLICSDVMTRGMDIENVEYVISYDMPQYIETYIHRVGRTARANKSGTAITFVDGKQAFHFKKMLKSTERWSKVKRKTISQDVLEPLVPAYTKALKVVPEILKAQRRKKRSSN